ncbi:phage late control D family protein [Sphaerotilaceae bacterium SBD11-9]
MDRARFAPDFALHIDGEPVEAPLRASIQSVSCTTGYDGVDEVQVTLANEHLRWLDNPRFRLGNRVTLLMGYAPSPLTQVFDGEVVARGAAFPGGGMPTLTVTAHDRRHKMRAGKKVRWFAIPITSVGNLPLPDIATAGITVLENAMLPIFDPVGAALSIILGGVDTFVTVVDPQSAQQVIRKQANESDYDFLGRIAGENGWDMLVEHDGPVGGHLLRFTSSLDRLQADFTYAWGHSLLDFSPRVSQVGQIGTVGGFVWVPAIKTTFVVTLGFDWDRMSLTLSIYPGIVPLGMKPGDYLIEEPLTATSIPRKLVSEIIPKLNKRLTASGSVVGDARMRPGQVLRIEGVGQEFGGLYRATSITHTIDAGGFRTKFNARKEIWFGSIPLADQGAVPVRVSF